jgi:hypothetical protein
VLRHHKLWYAACYHVPSTEASLFTSGCAHGDDDEVAAKACICMQQEESWEFVESLEQHS